MVELHKWDSLSVKLWLLCTDLVVLNGSLKWQMYHDEIPAAVAVATFIITIIDIALFNIACLFGTFHNEVLPPAIYTIDGTLKLWSAS